MLRTNRQNLHQSGGYPVVKVLIVLIILVVLAGIGLLVFRNHTPASNVAHAGSDDWTSMGTVSATNLDGEGVSVNVYACSENPNTANWVIEGEAVLSSAPSDPTNYYLNMYDYTEPDHTGSLLYGNSSNVWSSGTVANTSFVVGTKGQDDSNTISFEIDYRSPTSGAYTGAWAVGGDKSTTTLVPCN